MATRRTTVKVEVPAPNGTSAQQQHTMKASLDSPPLGGSPFLPTALECLLLAVYPATLLLGSLFSTLHPATRNAVYLADLQSYDPRQAPSYFAKKSNVFNVYFVKVGWFWVTLAFGLLVFTHRSLGPPPSITRKRVQALLRYACMTITWAAVTQWFFGPALIDRSFRWTGGKCEALAAEGVDVEDLARMGEVKDAFSHAACKAIGGQWRGGHDISGHVFLLILGSAMLWLELLPAVLRTQGRPEARQILTSDGLIRTAAIEGSDDKRTTAEGAGQESSGGLGIGIQAALVVAGLSWWMLFMTAAYFHTWFEKLTGLLVAFTAIYSFYFLPRAIPALRRLVGLPGV